MIDALSIFTRGGVLLWSHCLVKLRGDPISTLISTVLLEERSGGAVACIDSYNLKWKLVNDLELILVAVYPTSQPLHILDTLLDCVKTEFLACLSAQGGELLTKKSLLGAWPLDFDSRFLKIMRKCSQLTQNRVTVMRTFQESKKGKNARQETNPSLNSIRRRPQRPNNGGGKSSSGGAGDEASDSDDEDEEGIEEDVVDSGNGINKSMDKNSEFEVSQKTEFTDGRFSKGFNKANGKGTTTHSKADETPTKDTKKVARSWDNQKVTRKNMDALDFSKKKDSGGDENERSINNRTYGGDEDLEDFDISGSDSSFSDDEEPITEGQTEGSSSKSRWGGGIVDKLSYAIQNVTGGKVLTGTDLEEVLKDFKVMLMGKNVAADIVDMIGDSVQASLVDQKTERFTSVKATVKTALIAAVERILTPKKSVDVLRAALEAKAQGRVFSIVFLGVNGVGKSTNLAKVCYYLKHKGGLNVMIAACDTFRAGAVEQLRTHARCLDVHLYEKGYGKDAAHIAREALQFAKAENYDIVLIDTAGRMQDNEPLMRSLAKLVAMNNPDLILFVGEALVGNDAVDQLHKFNQCLVDMSMGSQRRVIDGIVLTKFDTVDDKVGAALSMVYTTGQPIVFIGTGQKYTHLRKLNVNMVVKALLG